MTPSPSCPHFLNSNIFKARCVFLPPQEMTPTLDAIERICSNAVTCTPHSRSFQSIPNPPKVSVPVERNISMDEAIQAMSIWGLYSEVGVLSQCGDVRLTYNRRNILDQHHQPAETARIPLVSPVSWLQPPPMAFQRRLVLSIRSLYLFFFCNFQHVLYLISSAARCPSMPSKPPCPAYFAKFTFR
ncbi:hypothetical protein GQ43DRAFT_278319 [Delitschia confertaspora ATCC 74209]|uniref:Uncharacterized protein n=1 Tax=Delitschia confertaspora ATCC 74209 TaxID=1513339 RepID=A0A9P4JB85_9PLEO|nr:hypothetical protein GQ43DRAFT_278319 [Delitschia confertaspora ATCC 74209]